MPPTPLDPVLYAAVKAEADRKFAGPTSAYKSGWIVKTYKDRGGKYVAATAPNTKPKPKTGLARWFAERWVDLNSPISNLQSPISMISLTCSKYMMSSTATNA